MMEERVLRLARSRLSKQVLDARQSRNERVATALQELTFTTTHIGLDATGQPYATLRLLTADYPIYLANEANRFFFASKLSESRSRNVCATDAAWQVIELYYAAYYAAHYLIRVSGHSVSNFDAATVKRIQNSGLGSTFATQLPRGLFSTTYGESSSELALRKLSSAGGSHISLWEHYLNFLDGIIAEAQKDPKEYKKELSQFNQHRQFVSPTPGTFLISQVRGEVNYQFEGGCWPFEASGTREVAVLQRRLSRVSSIYDADYSNVQKLITHCRFIASFANEIFCDISQRFSRSITRRESSRLNSWLS